MRQLLLLVFTACLALTDASLIVSSVDNPTYAAEYRCVSDDDSPVTNYKWYKQGQNSVPDGVQAEGNTLHFLEWTADVSGTYFCEAINQNGPKVATVYVDIQNSDKSFSTWFKKVLGLSV